MVREALPLERIVSGGQTGVDRGALDAALAEGFPCGGWCPEGRAAEDGVIDARYPLVELANAGYRERTIQNVADSDATLIVYFGDLHGGTELTLLACVRRGKPYKLVDAAEIAAERAAAIAGAFVARHGACALNVAGPRESHAPGAHAYAFEAIARLIGSARSGRQCA
jgi:hypothetical protein